MEAEATSRMRTATLILVAAAFAGTAAAEVRSSSSANYTIKKEVLSGGGGTASVAGKTVFCCFAQPQTGFMQAGTTARLGFLGATGAPPNAPVNLTACGGHEQVSLDWDDNIETDIAGYNVYRSETSGGPYMKMNGALVTGSAYTDTSAWNDMTFYYVVTAVDTGSLESLKSNEASATPHPNTGILGGGCGAPGVPTGPAAAAFVFAWALFAARRRRR